MKPNAIEYRSTFELRADAETGGFSGYASTFWRVDSYGTAMSPDAFTRTLADRGDRIPVLYQHNPAANIGVPELRIDANGLFVDATLIDDGADGTVALKRLRAGARFGLSFGFRTLQSRAASDTDPLDLAQILDATSLYEGLRVLTEVKLYEVSLVTFPANEAATISDVRSAAMNDALVAAIEAIRTNSLNDDQRGLIDAIVAARAASPDGLPAPREPELARRRVDLDIALARYGTFLR